MLHYIPHVAVAVAVVVVVVTYNSWLSVGPCSGPGIDVGGRE